MYVCMYATHLQKSPFSIFISWTHVHVTCQHLPSTLIDRSHLQPGAHAMLLQQDPTQRIRSHGPVLACFCRCGSSRRPERCRELMWTWSRRFVTHCDVSHSKLKWEVRESCQEAGVVVSWTRGWTPFWTDFMTLTCEEPSTSPSLVLYLLLRFVHRSRCCRAFLWGLAWT